MKKIVFIFSLSLIVLLSGCASKNNNANVKENSTAVQSNNSTIQTNPIENKKILTKEEVISLLKNHVDRTNYYEFSCQDQKDEKGFYIVIRKSPTPDSMAEKLSIDPSSGDIYENGNYETKRGNLITDFDKLTIKIGDQISEMVVVRTSESYSNNVIQFKGQVTISGTYTVNEENDYFYVPVSFIPDNQSVSKLPKMKQDSRYIWFAFTNDADQIKKAFGPVGSSGKATIVIDDYNIDCRPTETCNTAKLVKVVEINRDK